MHMKGALGAALAFLTFADAAPSNLEGVKLLNSFQFSYLGPSRVANL